MTRIRRNAKKGFSLMVATVLVTMVLTSVLLQLVLSGPTVPALQNGIRNNTYARAIALSALARMRDQIQTQLNAGTTINAGYTWSSNISTPNDPNNLTGSTTQIGTFTATVLKKSNNFYLVSATSTANGIQDTETRLFELAPSLQFILDKVPGALAAYSFRKLRAAYAGSAIQVQAVDSAGNPTGSLYNIGFTATGDLDTTTLLADLGVNISPPLDTVTGAAAAYSLRKLRTAYAGNAIKVRRTSDNTTQDIGFTASGDLDTTALTTFVGAANDGYVQTWYDQSGNGRDLTQTNSLLQPMIVDHTLTGSTKVIMENNHPAVYFDGALHPSGSAYQYMSYTNASSFNSASLTSYIVAKYISGGQDQGVVLSLMRTGDSRDYNSTTSAEVLARYTTTKYGIFQNNATTVQADIVWQSSAGESFNNTNDLFQAISNFTGTTDTLTLNGLISSSASITSNLQVNTISIGQEGLAGQNKQLECFQGKLSEVIFYMTNHSTANQALVSKNQMYYYQLYNAPIGRIAKWYDQSGNGNDLSSIGTNMPMIVVLPKPGAAFANTGQTNEFANTTLSSTVTGTQLSLFAVAMFNEYSPAEGVLAAMGGRLDGFDATGFFAAEENDGGYQPDVVTRYIHDSRNNGDQYAGKITLDQNFQTSIVFNGATAPVSINGVLGSTLPAYFSGTGASTGNFNASQLYIGRTTSNAPWAGTISEVIVYPSNPTQSTVENDQRTYFGTP